MVKVEARELTILLEERLLFKLLQWAGLGGGKGTWSGTSDSSEDELMNMFTHRYKYMHEHVCHSVVGQGLMLPNSEMTMYVEIWHIYISQIGCSVEC